MPRLGDRVDEQRETGGDRDGAARVEAAQRRDPALADDRARQREQERTYRDVDEEYPLPPCVLREDATQEHAGRCAAAAHGTPDTERLVAL